MHASTSALAAKKVTVGQHELVRDCKARPVGYAAVCMLRRRPAVAFCACRCVGPWTLLVLHSLAQEGSCSTVVTAPVVVAIIDVGICAEVSGRDELKSFELWTQWFSRGFIEDVDVQLLDTVLVICSFDLHALSICMYETVDPASISSKISHWPCAPSSARPARLQTANGATEPAKACTFKTCCASLAELV